MTTIMSYNYNACVKDKVNEFVNDCKWFAARDVTIALRSTPSAAKFTIHSNLVNNLVDFYMKSINSYEKQDNGTYIAYVPKVKAIPTLIQPVPTQSPLLSNGQIHWLTRGANGRYTVPKDLVLAAGFRVGQRVVLRNSGTILHFEPSGTGSGFSNQSGTYTVDKSTNIRCRLPLTTKGVMACIKGGKLTMS